MTVNLRIVMTVNIRYCNESKYRIIMIDIRHRNYN